MTAHVDALQKEIVPAEEQRAEYRSLVRGRAIAEVREARAEAELPARRRDLFGRLAALVGALVSGAF